MSWSYRLQTGVSVICGLWILMLSTSAAQTLPPVSFELAVEEYGSAPTFQVSLGDLDTDGDPDAVFANMGFNASRVLLNDGHGSFVYSDQALTEQGHGVELGDLDGDGDLDLFVTCAGYIVDGVGYTRPSRVYLNFGDGRFMDSGQDLGDTESSGNLVQLVDVDNDNDLDAFVVYYLEPARVYLNDGAAWFLISDLELPAGSSWADLDGDGDADVFIKEEGVGYRVLLNDGRGGLSDWWAEGDDTVTSGYRSIAFADLDDDGDLDGFDSNGTFDEEQPVRVLLNDGSGVFSVSPQPIGAVNRSWVALGDLNDDGHVDAFVSRVFRPNEVWLNDGQGEFLDSGLRLGGDTLTRGCDLGDLDADGDLDIFVARYEFEGAPNEVWINCARVGRCRDRAQPCCSNAEFTRRPSGRRRP